MDTLYDADILLWSEHQAALLRRKAAGELINDAEFDWTNIAEEIGDIGSNCLHEVESLLVSALVHILKAEAWPQSDAVPHWQSETRNFLGQARRRYVASMHQRIAIAELYASALKILPTSIDGAPPLPVPAACPMTLDALLGVTEVAPGMTWDEAVHQMLRKPPPVGA